MNKAKIIRIVTIAVIVLILVLLTSVLAFSQHIPAAEQETKELTSEQLEWQKHFKETQMNYLLSLSDNEFETLMENRYGDYTYWSDEYIDELRAKRKN